MQETNVVHFDRKPRHQYRGHGYSLYRDKTGMWQVKVVIPLRPAVFKNQFKTRVEAESWMKQTIESLEV